MDAEEAVKYAFPVAIRVSYPSQAPGEPVAAGFGCFRVLVRRSSSAGAARSGRDVRVSCLRRGRSRRGTP
jgi:hypothetical protein